MNKELKLKIDKLQANYTNVVGHSFKYFYCPILYKDENVPLCRSHIINKDIYGAARAWTVQRKDVDNFYGSNFEADFTNFQYANKSPVEMLTNKELHKKLKPEMLLNRNQVDYFIGKEKIPEQFTPITFGHDGRSVIIGLKIPRNVVATSIGGKLEINVKKDIRIAAMVSLIKAAYLTAFEMLCYKYALSASGAYIGYQILGKFFRQNYNNKKTYICQNASSFFLEYVNMVRPIQSVGFSILGTITDKIILVCWGSSGNAWAIIVFIRTGKTLHSVMLPVFDNMNMISIYIDFMKNKNESIEVSFCRYEKEQDLWAINKKRTRITWPKTGISFP